MTREEDSTFDHVLDFIGSDGYFQKRFNVLFNFLLLIVVTMPNLNIVISLSVPEHWCHVPGRELTNYSIEQWKLLTIPRVGDKFNRCKMFNVSVENLDENYTAPENVIDCHYGWEYDHTWYTRTVSSQENWVCDRDLHVTNTFVFSKIGDFLGTFIFGQLADMFGRRPIFFITLIILLIGRCLTVFTASYIWIFSFAVLFGNLATPAVFQCPLIISIEMSKNENRAFIVMTQAIGATCGLCLMPLIMWFFRDWVPFMLATSIPCALFLLSGSCIIESPRWLASKGKTKTCVKELEKMAVANQTSVGDDIVVILSNLKKDESFGFMTLFSSWVLAKNTALLVSTWIVATLIYYTLILNVNNLGGNPFQNYFWQGLVELPAYVLGKCACDSIGRRCTHAWGFIATALGCIPLLLVINDQNYVTCASALAVFIKFSASFTYYAVNLHAVETYPTCIRQTGVSFGVLTASAFGTLAPYIVYLGTSVDLRCPYAIILILGVIGVCCGSPLPETLNRTLPETLEDARNFGANQRFWSWPKPLKNRSDASGVI